VSLLTVCPDLAVPAVIGNMQNLNWTAGARCDRAEFVPLAVAAREWRARSPGTGWARMRRKR